MEEEIIFTEKEEPLAEQEGVEELEEEEEIVPTVN